MSQRLFVQSCHASLEYDHARMFKDLGYSVFGDWDIGSKQRPKIEGVTDNNSDIKDFDLIILHQVPNYVDVMRGLLEAGKRVVLISFGQADTWQYEACSKLCRDYEHAYLAPYSVKDHRRHKEAGCPDHKSKLLYFGKYFEDFEPWQGGDPVCYATCNSIHKRGHGCGWELMKQLKQQVPVMLSGKETDEVGGLGEIPESSMRERMRDCSAFVSFGTMPAALIMSQIEAWCAGCPTVCYDNGHGLAEEGMPLILETDVQKMVTQARRLCADPVYKQEWHQNSLRNRERFDVKRVGPEWVDFINRIMR